MYDYTSSTSASETSFVHPGKRGANRGPKRPSPVAAWQKAAKCCNKAMTWDPSHPPHGMTIRTKPRRQRMQDAALAPQIFCNQTGRECFSPAGRCDEAIELLRAALAGRGAQVEVRKCMFVGLGLCFCSPPNNLRERRSQSTSLPCFFPSLAGTRLIYLRRAQSHGCSRLRRCSRSQRFPKSKSFAKEADDWLRQLGLTWKPLGSAQQGQGFRKRRAFSGQDMRRRIYWIATDHDLKGA